MRWPRWRRKRRWPGGKKKEETAGPSQDKVEGPRKKWVGEECGLSRAFVAGFKEVLVWDI